MRITTTRQTSPCARCARVEDAAAGPALLPCTTTRSLIHPPLHLLIPGGAACCGGCSSRPHLTCSSPAAHPPQPPTPQHTRLQLVEQYGEEAGVAFLPKPGRTHAGLQVYAFGLVSCTVDNAQVRCAALLHAALRPHGTLCRQCRAALRHAVTRGRAAASERACTCLAGHRPPLAPCCASACPPAERGPGADGRRCRHLGHCVP